MYANRTLVLASLAPSTSLEPRLCTRLAQYTFYLMPTANVFCAGSMITDRHAVAASAEGFVPKTLHLLITHKLSCGIFETVKVTQAVSCDLVSVSKFYDLLLQ